MLCFDAITNTLTAKARELGCEEPPTIPDLGWFGINHLKRIIAADKQQLLPDFLIERQEEMAKQFGHPCTTIKGNIFGKVWQSLSNPIDDTFN